MFAHTGPKRVSGTGYLIRKEIVSDLRDRGFILPNSMLGEGIVSNVSLLSLDALNKTR